MAMFDEKAPDSVGPADQVRGQGRTMTPALVVNSNAISGAPPCVGLARGDNVTFRRAAFCVGLIVALAASRGALAQTKSQGPSLREAGGNPLWAVPVTALSATRERPIFQTSRRPPRPAVVAGPVVEIFKPPPLPVEPDRPGLILIGAVVSETEGIAVFVDELTRNIVRLKMGEDHTGWFLRSVKKREVLLQKADEAVTLVLPVSTDEQRTVLPGLSPATGVPVLPGLTRASPLATGGPPPGLPAVIAPPVTGRLPGL